MESNAQSLQNERDLLHQNGEQEQGGISPMVYVFKLLYFWPYLVVAMVLGLAGAFVYNRYAQPVYKINSSLLVIENKGGGGAMKNLDAVLMSGGLGGMTSTTDNELGIIQSFTLVFGPQGIGLWGAPHQTGSIQPRRGLPPPWDRGGGGQFPPPIGGPEPAH